MLHSLDDANFLERRTAWWGGNVQKCYRTTPLGDRALEEARSTILELGNEIMDSTRKHGTARKRGGKLAVVRAG